jgi:cytochrome c oxidase subunit III
MMPPRFTDDVAHLPTTGYGVQALTWWGVIAFMTIEGAAFALAFAAYFFLMSQEQSWPPGNMPPPDLLAGSLFTLVMLLSEIPNTLTKRAADGEKLRGVQLGLLVMVAIAIPLFVLRGLEFAHLNVRWTDNAYGSILWALLVLHTVHVLTDWVDTAVLAALMFTPHGPTERRFGDVSENALYWRFVWLTWLPIYLMIYWVPRWVP